MLLTKQHLVNTVDERWKNQYYRGGSWNYCADKEYKQLVNLGKNKNPEDVDKIICNSYWTILKCHNCNNDVDAVFIFCTDEEYSCYVCEDCVKIAIQKFNELT